MDDIKAPPAERAERLVQQMTVEEVISQLHNNSPAIPRLSIPEYNWWNECLHGVARAGLATVFPQAIGLASSWDTALLEKVADATADEARAKHHEAERRGYRGMFHGLTMWSPNINIYRDPRWGRGQETYGEDPYLTGRLAVAFIRGLQGSHPEYFKTIATPKHLAAHSGPEGLRHSFNAVVDERDLWETYLPQFEMAVREGKAYSVMGAYSRVNGEACCASSRLLSDILRNKWGFEGYVVSDCGAIEDIYLHHKLADSPEAAAALAINNGNDLHCMYFYPSAYNELALALDKGLVREETLRKAAARLLTARFRLGMFAPPEEVPYASIPFEVVDCPAHRKLALEAARASMVLLKNENDMLPLPEQPLKIAVVGPNANAPDVQWGNYNGLPSETVTVREGLRRALPDGSEVWLEEGCPLAEGVPVLEIIPTHFLQTESGQPGLRASYFSNPGLEGRPALTRADSEVNFNWFVDPPAEGLPADGYSVRWEGFLCPPEDGLYEVGAFCLQFFCLYINDELAIDNWAGAFTGMPSVKIPLRKGQPCPIRLEVRKLRDFGSAALAWSTPKDGSVNPEARALTVAANADIIVAVMGLSPRLEGEEVPFQIDGFREGDRTRIELPDVQEAFLAKLHQTGKPVVLVLMNGGALALGPAARQCRAILEAWYPGQAGGTAVADVLLGRHNPSGKLPVTFYCSTENLPPFEDYSMENRTYRFFKGSVLFPFGHGLSYTRFEYTRLEVPDEVSAKDGQLTVSVSVRNAGASAGAEVAQLYVSLPDTYGRTPIHSLQGFQKVYLEPGQETRLAFSLDARQLARINEEGLFLLEPGTIKIAVGGGQPGHTSSIASKTVRRESAPGRLEME
ncbi:MAG: glycoside hydrolase family 3 C-terminal domain-containing protein [Lewinellaceae bacterium]|nr:glycoside hydrolase family 3 C-terminal domain-containing protein [Lewinellaceae bacterium]